jgi:chromatin modification-related protein EAF6
MIWNKEGSYLEDTSAGNIMKGFDNYIKASSAPGTAGATGGGGSRRKAAVSDQDRLFSRSSVSYYNSMRVCFLSNI